MAMVRALSIRRNMPRHPFEGWREVWRALRRAFWAIIAPFLLVGGMFSGVFTPTEAAAVAVVYALILGLYVYREFRWRDLPRLIIDTVETTGVVMALVMTATLLGYCLTVARIPQAFGEWLTALTTNPLVFLLIVNVLLLVVGCFMEALAAMLVLIPILVPTALKLGVDPIQFGLVFVLNLMIGTITPPVGVVLFVTAKVAGVPFDRLARATLPYLWALIAVLILITVWPAVTTFLPHLLMDK